MTKQALLSEILQLPVEDRIALVAEVWDAIAADREEVPIPAWHLEVIDRRLSDPDPEYLSWEEVRERLRALAER